MLKISLITVTYNSAITISNTIESVFNQSFPNIEYIIVDGFSKDATVEIIRI
jgi:glycosyltransferase involved in cell wall biosynthesis